VTSWLSVAIGVLGSLAIAAVIFITSGTPSAAAMPALAAVAVAAVLVGLRLGSVRLTVSPIGVSVGFGLRGRTRWIPAEQLTHAQATRLTWPQVYGLGLPQSWRLTRMTVKAGPTLRLWLHAGEQLWITTADASRAAALLSDQSPHVTEATREAP
jgi:hypothetical protein